MTIEKYAPVTHPRFNGIALRFLGHPTEKLCEPDHPTCWDDGFCVEIDVTEEALVHMVGDDRKHRVSMDELTIIEEGDFCSGCGQTGCLHGR